MNELELNDFDKLAECILIRQYCMEKFRQWLQMWMENKRINETNVFKIR